MPKRLMKFLFFAFLLFCVPGLGEESAHPAERIVYGKSELGRELVCRRIGDADAPYSLLLVFGIHGFEDIYDHDAELLRDMAERLIAHYRQELPENVCLYVIPSANPDGLEEGESCDSFGRLTAAGIDPNRDFPVRWKDNSNSRTARNRTGTAPFSAAETRALRDFVSEIHPTWGIDVHGYISAVYGSGTMANTFSSAMKLKRRDCISGGMMCEWFAEVLEDGIMIEMPSFRPGKGFDREGYVAKNTQRLIEGVDAWLKKKAKQ